METDIIAAVATFRAFSSRVSAPSLTAPILPPSREDRMATTLVCEGPLMLSKLATNEITYLQVNNFTRAIMPRSRIWRVSETEIVIPATSSNFWLITLKGSPQAVERFARVISGLCKYERFYENDEEVEKYEDHKVKDRCSPTCSEYSFEASAPGPESQHVIDARQIIKKGDMSMWLSAVSSKNAHDKRRKTSFSDDSAESLFTYQEWPSSNSRNTMTPPSPDDMDHNSTSSTLCETVSSDTHDDLILELVEASTPVCRSSNFREEPLNGGPNTPEMSVTTQNAVERKQSYIKNGTNEATRSLTSPTAFLPSPPATPLAVDVLMPPKTPQREYRIVRDTIGNHVNTTDTKPDYKTTVKTKTNDPMTDALLDSGEFSTAMPSVVSTPNSKRATNQETIAKHNLQSAETSLHSSSDDEELNADVRPPADLRYTPRFLHPLIPTSHISRYYPQFNVTGSVDTHNSSVKEEHLSTLLPPTIPRRALGRRDLLTIGPGVFHPEVTTVGGYISLMTIKGLLRKT